MHKPPLRRLSALLPLSMCYSLQAMGQRVSSAPDSLCAVYAATATILPDSGVRIRALKQCGSDGVAAIAQLIHSASTRRDRAYLRDLVFEAQVKAPLIEAAATALFQDRAAPIEARFAGLNILLQQYFGPAVGIAVPDRTPPDRMTTRTACLLAGNAKAQSPTVTAALRQLIERVMGDPSQPEAIRTASRCVREGLAPRYVSSIDISRISITAACAAGASVRNDLDEMATLSWRAAVGSTRGAIKVREHSQIIFTPGVEGAIRFFNADGTQFIGQVTLRKQDKCPRLGRLGSTKQHSWGRLRAKGAPIQLKCRNVGRKGARHMPRGPTPSVSLATAKRTARYEPPHHAMPDEHYTHVTASLACSTTGLPKRKS
jgi:hypothetical protein